MVESIQCPSRITRVVVYARGAVVTRRVELPVGLPAEGVDLVISGVTPLAQPGSIRTHVDGERRITGLQAPTVWPEAQQHTPDQAAIQRLERELQQTTERRERLRGHVRNLESIALDGSFLPTDEGPAPDTRARATTTLEMADILHRLLTDMDKQAAKLEDDIRRLRNEIAAARSVPVVIRSDQPQRHVVISLAAGSDHLRALEVSYNVAAARWWPAYAARLSNGGKQAEFSVEAFVSQNTLESWVDVELSLCTADLISDISLPELQSLRLGRAQPARATGFREPPEGLDAMFRGHDAAFAAPPPAPPKPQPVPRDVFVESVASRSEFDAMYDEAEGQAMASMSMPPAPAGAPAPQRAKKSRGGPSRSDMAKEAMAEMEMDDMSPEEAAFGGSGAMPVASEPAPSGPLVGDDWLDFDSLQLPPSEDRTRRGRLAVATQPAFGRLGELINRVEGQAAPDGARDPLYTRGMFDHQFDADGVLEIPASGTAHRVRLISRDAKSTMIFRCVPLADERVFREVEIENPLEAPLLPGPVDVFMDGALLITSAVADTEVGGVIRFGLGEEQRVRVARNVRAREESAGVFKGKTAMQHEITFEVASSLAVDITLELVDRIPVTSDKDIDIKLVSTEPKAETYHQHERRSHVNGGLRWQLPVKAGSTAVAKLTYLIGFDKDFELVGGNRRA